MGRGAGGLGSAVWQEDGMSLSDDASQYALLFSSTQPSLQMSTADEAGREAGRQVGRQTERQPGKQSGSQASWQVGELAGKLASRPTGDSGRLVRGTGGAAAEGTGTSEHY